MITSKRGYWYSHIIEDGFRDIGEAWTKSLNALQNGDAKSTAPGSLTGEGGILEQTCDNDVRMYIMSKGKPDDYDPDTDTEIVGEPVYQDKVNELIGVLQTNDGAPLTNTALLAIFYNAVPGDLDACKSV